MAPSLAPSLSPSIRHGPWAELAPMVQPRAELAPVRVHAAPPWIRVHLGSRCTKDSGAHIHVEFRCTGPCDRSLVSNRRSGDGPMSGRELSGREKGGVGPRPLVHAWWAACAALHTSPNWQGLLRTQQVMSEWLQPAKLEAEPRCLHPKSPSGAGWHGRCALVATGMVSCTSYYHLP